MATTEQRRENTAHILTALGQILADATPNRNDAAIDALTDQDINDRCDELLTGLGHPDYRHPAAA